MSGAPYRRARAAAFMGKRIVEEAAGGAWPWVSELPRTAVDELPEALDGAAFLDRWGAPTTPSPPSIPTRRIPCAPPPRSASRSTPGPRRPSPTSAARDVDALGPLMAASHAGYDAMGLGHPAATAAVEAVLDRPGVHGARSSGGGSGGTVVVLCDRGALDDVDDLIR